MSDRLTDARSTRLEHVLAALRARFGDWIIYRLSEARTRQVHGAIATGSLGLDWATGIGGVPRGHLTTILGPATSGKTTLAAHVLAHAQENHGFAVLIDADHAVDATVLQRCGVRLPDLLLVVPESAREAFDIAALLIASNGVDALVTATANGLVVGPGGDTCAFAAGIRRWTVELAHAHTAAVMLVRTDAGWQRAGRNAGRILAHAAALSVALQPRGVVTHLSGEVLGLRLDADIVKNRLAPPARRAAFEVWRDRGIHAAAELFDLGCAQGLVEARSGFWFQSVWLGRGRAASIQTLDEDPDIARALRTALEQGELAVRYG